MSEEDDPPKSPRQRFYAAVWRLAHALDPANDQGAIPSGDASALRREDGARSPTFYKIATLLLSSELEGLRGELLGEAERRWARVVHLLARTGGLHRLGAPSVGTALANAGVAEARLLRLLRAEGDATDAAARAAVAPLVQRAMAFDPVDLAALVLSAPSAAWRFHIEDGDAVRRRVARDFYRAAASPDANA